MNKDGRYTVELLFGDSKSTGNLIVDGKDITRMDTGNFGEALELTDKRLFFQWADGCTIFHLTERQYNKFIKIVNTYEYTNNCNA